MGKDLVDAAVAQSGRLTQDLDLCPISTDLERKTRQSP